MPLLHEDRLFPADPGVRAVARSLYATVRDLPIVSPHGHTDPRWFAENRPFADPAQLVAPGDAAALGRAIVASLDDLPAAEARAQRLRERVRALFSQDSMVEGVLTGYSDAIASKFHRSH